MLSNIENVLGSDFDDLIEGNLSPNVLDGAAGVDTVSYANFGSGVIIDLSFNVGVDAGGVDTLLNFENATGTGFNDAIAASAATNVLNGGAGIDTVSYYAAAGPVAIDLAAGVGVDPTSVDTLLNFENANGSGFNDAISATAATNVLNGLGGNDTVSYYLAANGVTINLAATSGNDGTSIDTLLNFENANGSAFADVIIGDDGPNRLNGLGGADQLTGGGGDDTFILAAGQSNGEIVTDFSGNGAAAGNSFLFLGFGTAGQGATFTQLNATSVANPFWP